MGLVLQLRRQSFFVGLGWGGASEGRMGPRGVIQPDSSTPINLASTRSSTSIIPGSVAKSACRAWWRRGLGLRDAPYKGEVQARALEVPLWMFDRLTCLSVRIRKRPEVDLAALEALQSLLAEVSRPGEDAPAVSSIIPDSVTDLPSVNQDQGGDHGVHLTRKQGNGFCSVPTYRTVPGARRHGGVCRFKRGRRRSSCWQGCSSNIAGRR